MTARESLDGTSFWRGSRTYTNRASGRGASPLVLSVPRVASGVGRDDSREPRDGSRNSFKSGVKSRDISACVPIAVRQRHRRMAVACLVVDVPQLAARVLQEKFALNPIDRGEEVYEEDSKPREKHGPVLMKNKALVRHHKFQLAHEPKQTGEQNRERDKQCICDHNLASSFMRKFVSLFRSV